MTHEELKNLPAFRGEIAACKLVPVSDREGVCALLIEGRDHSKTHGETPRCAWLVRDEALQALVELTA